jgi:DNA-binding GntR family transcriptional regulator
MKTSGNAVREQTPPPIASRPAWTPSVKPLPHVSLGQFIVSSLRESIVNGILLPGQQLKQDMIGADFNVSPAPVREALRQLESEGLVEHFPNRGVFVSNIREDEVLNLLLPIRLVIENYALQQVAGRLESDLAHRLHEQIEIMQQAADAGDVARINSADARFHELAVEASGSAQAVQLWHSISPRVRLQFSQLTPRQTDLHHVAEEHRELLSLLHEGDEGKLYSVLKEHIVGISVRLMGREEEAPIIEGDGMPST